MSLKRFLKRLMTLVCHPVCILRYRNFKGTIIYPDVVLKNAKKMRIINSEITRGCEIKCFKTDCKDHYYLDINSSYIGDKCYISSGGGIKFNKCRLAPEVFVGSYQHDLSPLATGKDKKDGFYTITIDEMTFIGQKSVIVGNVCIGKCSLVGAGSVVTKSVPCFSMVVGNPGKIIKRFDTSRNEWVKV